MDFYDKLIQKWGKFKHVQHWYEQINTVFISQKSKLNLLYESLGNTKASTLFKNELNVEIPKQLAEFYSKYNGCRLFSNSLCIYGFQVHLDETYEPFDIGKENARLLCEKKKLKDYIIFGSLGGQFMLAYTKNQNEILAINISNLKVVKKYPDFNDCFTSIFEKLYDEYDIQGKKKSINKKYSKIPVLANLTFDEKFL